MDRLAECLSNEVKLTAPTPWMRDWEVKFSSFLIERARHVHVICHCFRRLCKAIGMCSWSLIWPKRAKFIPCCCRGTDRSRACNFKEMSKRYHFCHDHLDNGYEDFSRRMFFQHKGQRLYRKWEIHTGVGMDYLKDLIDRYLVYMCALYFKILGDESLDNRC